MYKPIFQSVVLSSVLLLSGCTEVEFSFGFIALVGILWGISHIIIKNQEAKDANVRSTTRAKIQNTFRKDGLSDTNLSVMQSNILVGVRGRGGLAIDTTNKRIGILHGEGTHVQPTMISYRDVLSSEIIEDGETVTKTSRGSQIGGALIGGLALGGVGAIIGGLSGATKSADKVSQIALMITINEVNNPVHYVMLLNDGVNYKKSDPVYKNAMGEAQKWHGKIQVLIRQADEEDRRQEKQDAMNTVAVVPQASIADELAKLGKLRDSGVLTETEFDSQKAKLLEK